MLTGALVGGPSGPGDNTYTDSRDDFETNEASGRPLSWDWALALLEPTLGSRVERPAKWALPGRALEPTGLQCSDAAGRVPSNMLKASTASLCCCAINRPQLQVSIDYNAGLTAALAGLLALEPDCCAATFT